jgi:putative hydrolase of the HAD superfamily
VFAAILFDADNTLWDTNAVFRDAQLALLGVLQDGVPPLPPEEALLTLRALDMTLVERLGRFEYDIEQLITALILHWTTDLQGDALLNRARSVPSPLDARQQDLVAAAKRAFMEGLNQIPELLPDTVEVLARLHAARLAGAPLVTAVLSEGDPDRLERVFNAYHVDIASIFDEILVGPKSQRLFELARGAMVDLLNAPVDPAATRFVIVGDALKRDVKFGNQAGFTSVYKPASFLGVEQPNADDEVPDFTISRFRELPPILEQLGIVRPPIEQPHPPVTARPILINRLGA